MDLEFIQSEIGTLQDKVDEIGLNLVSHTSKEEVFQGNLEQSMKKVGDLEARFSRMESNYTRIEALITEHVADSKELSRNIQRSIWGAFTIAVGAGLSLLWEWFKTLVLSKPHP